MPSVAVFVRCLVLALAALVGSVPVLAHHGWEWAEDQNVELTGVIESARLGNPHGELVMLVDGKKWTVEVGQPWRNARAGLKDDMLAKGVKLTVSGHRSKNPSQLVFNAERVFIDGKRHDLYPDRD